MLSITRVMAGALYQCEPVKLFHFHKQYGADPLKILIAAKFFRKLGAASIQGNVLSPTTGSREFLFRHRRKFFGEVSTEWRSQSQGTMEPFEPYLPDLGRVDVDFFQNFIDPMDEPLQ